jgi:hypothetical protein
MSMKAADRSKVRQMIPEAYKKSWIIGGFGAGIGAGIGGYVDAIRGTNIYAGIGGGAGCVAGYIIGLLLNRKTTLFSLARTEKIVNIVLGLLGLLFTVVGIIGFIITREWMMMVSGMFFGSIALYLLRRKEKCGER